MAAKHMSAYIALTKAVLDEYRDTHKLLSTLQLSLAQFSCF